MLNKNIPFDVDYKSCYLDDLHNQITGMLLDQKSNIINIPDFILLAKQKLRISADRIKLGLVIVAKRNPSLFYLERISEHYTDQRRHYVLFDGFVRNRILIRCPS